MNSLPNLRGQRVRRRARALLRILLLGLLQSKRGDERLRVVHARDAVLQRREDDLQLEERRLLGLLGSTRLTRKYTSPEVAVLEPGLRA